MAVTDVAWVREQRALFKVQPDQPRTNETGAGYGTRGDNGLFVGDALCVLRGAPSECYQCCVTSPPYWGLRDYGIVGQIGAETTLEEYIQHLVQIFGEVRRTLKPSGTLWLNVGDSYTSGNRTWRDADKKNPARGMDYRAPTPQGLKPKDLIGVPWRLAFALQADGWYLRADIVWNKPNGQPESVRDRPTRSHEYVFLLTKSERYYYDHEAIKEPATSTDKPKNKRTVWNVNTEPNGEAHFATFPSKADRALHPRRYSAWRPGFRPLLRLRDDRRRLRQLRPLL